MAAPCNWLLTHYSSVKIDPKGKTSWLPSLLTVITQIGQPFKEYPPNPVARRKNCFANSITTRHNKSIYPSTTELIAIISSSSMECTKTLWKSRVSWILLFRIGCCCGAVFNFKHVRGWHTDYREMSSFCRLTIPDMVQEAKRWCWSVPTVTMFEEKTLAFLPITLESTIKGSSLAQY